MSNATRMIVMLSIAVCPFFGIGMIVGYYTNRPIDVADMPAKLLRNNRGST